MTPSRPLEIELPMPVFTVGQRKYNIDARCPWWERAFFRCVYLPFNRFAFHWFHIPAMDEVTVTEKKTTFCWYEDKGAFSTRERADAASKNEFDRIKPLYMDVEEPDESVMNGYIQPRAKKPYRYAKPSFELVATPRKQLERGTAKLKHEVAKLNRVLGT